MNYYRFSVAILWGFLRGKRKMGAMVGNAFEERPPPKVLQFYTSAFGMISYSNFVFFFFLSNKKENTKQKT